jgi:hypothetical protein
MSALTLSRIIFVLTLGGAILGTLLRRALPKHHLSSHAKDAVRLGAGLTATIAALVVGLLIAAAKGSFDTQTSQVRQITANLIPLDNILAQYGPETRAIREQIRGTIDRFADGLWREKKAGTTGPVETNAAAEQVYLEIHKLSPHDDLQRLLKTRAVQISNDLVQVRFLAVRRIRKSDREALNGTVFTCLFLFALSAASAIFLIMELSRPFTGLMMITSAPLRNALGTI